MGHVQFAERKILRFFLPVLKQAEAVRLPISPRENNQKNNLIASETDAVLTGLKCLSQMRACHLSNAYAFLTCITSRALGRIRLSISTLQIDQAELRVLILLPLGEKPIQVTYLS
jgi:hypothetical protein